MGARFNRWDGTEEGEAKYQEDMARFNRLALSFGAVPDKLELLQEGFEECLADMQAEAFSAAFGDDAPSDTVREENVNILLAWLRLRAPHLFRLPN